MKRLIKWILILGTIPYVVFASLLCIGVEFMAPGRMEILFLSYSALILSFVGGMNWAYISVESGNPKFTFNVGHAFYIIWATLLMFIGWMTLFIHKHPVAFLIMGALYCGEMYVEHFYRYFYPYWMATYRFYPMLISVIMLFGIFSYKFFA